MGVVGAIADLTMGVGILTVVLLGCMTILPASFWPLGKNREKRCFFGYASHCPMAPFSTAITLGFAYFLYWYGFILR